MDQPPFGGSQPKLLILSEGYSRHESALRASLRAEYQIRDIRRESVVDLADLVAWLPAGCAFWRSVGGPLSLTEQAHSLRMIDYRLQVLVWSKTKDAEHNRNHPTPPEPIPYAGEARVIESHAKRQAQARKRRMSAS